MFKVNFQIVDVTVARHWCRADVLFTREMALNYYTEFRLDTSAFFDTAPAWQYSSIPAGDQDSGVPATRLAG